MKKPKNPYKGEIWDAGKKLYFYDGEEWIDITVVREAFGEVIATMMEKWIKKYLREFIEKGGDQNGKRN